MATKINFLIAFFMVIAVDSFPQDLVYKPINPAFGGETFNYQWLMSSALEQNKFKEESSLGLYGKDPLEDFKNSLNRQILNQLSRKLADNLFGENGLENGTYEMGDFQISISSTLAGINIYILNTADGNETSIIVPYY